MQSQKQRTILSQNVQKYAMNDDQMIQKYKQ